MRIKFKTNVIPQSMKDIDKRKVPSVMAMQEQNMET